MRFDQDALADCAMTDPSSAPLIRPDVDRNGPEWHPNKIPSDPIRPRGGSIDGGSVGRSVFLSHGGSVRRGRRGRGPPVHHHHGWVEGSTDYRGGENHCQ